MKILLAYSTDHFRPDVDPAEQPNWGGSANVLARTLHSLLSERGDVTYVDVTDVDAVRGRSFDLYVGPAHRSAALLGVIEAGKVVLVAVNHHPAERNRILLDFASAHRVPPTAFTGSDIASVEDFAASAERADAILVLGNVAVLNSYVEQGVELRRLRVLNYATAPPRDAVPARAPGPLRLVHVASELGLRKGFDVLDGLVRRALEQGLDFTLDLVGPPASRHYEGKVAELVRDAGGRVRAHGRLGPLSDEYDAVLAAADVHLFPSLEEGQAGTILDAMARGVVPLATAASGVDFGPLGLLEPDPASEANLELLARACKLGDAEIDHLRRRTVEAYRELHEGFEVPLADAIDGALQGSPWPKASVTVPVFNKEKTITRLLGHLDDALVAYGNAELHVILDGCSDRSEERVREFFAGRDAYPVRIETTPDIFEVKTNNIALRAATGAYGVIVQDDNFIYARDFLFEAVTFLEKDRRAAILGCLAGVNFYPRGTTGLEGPGQIVMDDNEVYWRQDAETDPALRDRFFGVDACMRGPLILRKSFLEEHGYLDEEYAPLHQDDMDISFRAHDRGFGVYACLMDVENESGSVASYSPERHRWHQDMIRRNTGIFYGRWQPSVEKDYLWVHRIRLAPGERSGTDQLRDLRTTARRRYIHARRTWLHVGHVTLPLRRLRQRIAR